MGESFISEYFHMNFNSQCIIAIVIKYDKENVDLESGVYNYVIR